MFARSPLDRDMSFLSCSITFALLLLSSTLRGRSVFIVYTLIARLLSIAFNVGRMSIRLSSLAISKIDLFKLSSTCGDRTPNFRGLAKIDKILLAAC